MREEVWLQACARLAMGDPLPIIAKLAKLCGMGTRNINLTDALDRFVDRQIESGAYQNASEVLRAGLRLLKAEQDVRAAKLRRLKAAIDEALGDLEAGRYEEVELGDLESWFDRVSAEADAEVARRRANRR